MRHVPVLPVLLVLSFHASAATISCTLPSPVTIRFSDERDIWRTIWAITWSNRGTRPEMDDFLGVDGKPVSTDLNYSTTQGLRYDYSMTTTGTAPDGSVLVAKWNQVSDGPPTHSNSPTPTLSLDFRPTRPGNAFASNMRLWNGHNGYQITAGTGTADPLRIRTEFALTISQVGSAVLFTTPVGYGYTTPTLYAAIPTHYSSIGIEDGGAPEPTPPSHPIQLSCTLAGAQLSIIATRELELGPIATGKTATGEIIVRVTSAPLINQGTLTFSAPNDAEDPDAYQLGGGKFTLYDAKTNTLVKPNTPIHVTDMENTFRVEATAKSNATGPAVTNLRVDMVVN